MTKIYECKCGKKFYKHANWLYQLKGKFYCSYNCWRDAGGDNKKDYRRKYDSR